MQIWKEIGAANLFQIFIQMAWESSVSNHELDDEFSSNGKAWHGVIFLIMGQVDKTKL